MCSVSHYISKSISLGRVCMWKYSPVCCDYHPCSVLSALASSWNLELTQRGADPHPRKSPLVPVPVPLARASTPPVRPLLLQSAQAQGGLGEAGVLEPRGPT